MEVMKKFRNYNYQKNKINFFLIIEMVLFNSQESQVIINNIAYQVDKNLTFQKDNIQYVVYSFPFAIRKHTSHWEFKRQLVNCYAIIPYNMVIQWLEIVFALLSGNFNVNLTNSTVQFQNLDMREAFDKLKNIFKSSEHDEKQAEYVKLIDMILASLDLEEVKAYINEAQPIKFNVNINNENVATILQYVIEIIYQFMNYHENLIQFHSLSCNADIICYILTLVLILNSQFDEEACINQNAMSVHLILSLIVDLLTDQCGQILYIQGKHELALNWKQQYIHKYPFLTKISKIDDLQKFANHIKMMDATATNENRLMYPFVLAFHMNYFDQFKFRMNLLLNNIPGNTLTAEQIFQKILLPIVENINESGVYVEESFLQILNDKDLLEKIVKFTESFKQKEDD